MKKKYWFMMIITIFTVGIGFFFVNSLSANAEGYVAIDMSPSIEFVTGRSGAVIKVNALNEEGEMIIANEDFIGMDVGEACEKVVTIGIELGYIDIEATESNPNPVMVTTLYKNSRIANRIKRNIYQRLDKYFMNQGIWAIILTDEDMDALKDEAETLGISPAKLRLIKSIQTVDPSFETTTGAKMSVKGLLDIVKEKRPFAAKIEALNTRKEEILTLLETTTDENEKSALNAELTNIENQLSQFDLMKQQIQEHKQVLKERYRDRVERFRENHPNRIRRWQQFKDHLTEEQRQTLRETLYQRLNERFG